MTRLLFTAALAVAAAGCGSNNAGKIVGRWKADAADLPVSPKGPADVVWEFGDDGSFTITRILPGRGEPAVNVSETLAVGKYTLGRRDIVAFSQMNPPMDGKKTRTAEQVVIDGDTMTVGGRGKDPTYRFTRLP